MTQYKNSMITNTINLVLCIILCITLDFEEHTAPKIFAGLGILVSVYALYSNYKNNTNKEK